MFALIKRVLDLAGSFSPAARRSLTWGMVCNILKAFFMAGMLGAVFWALENRDHLDAVVALQCLGILAVSVIGQYVFQYLVDITMDAQGFHIFRDLRLRVGDRLKAAPMGYFSEQRLSAVTTTLTTTVHQLEEFMTICLTGLTGGVAMAVIMSLFFLAVAWPIAAITFAGIAAGLCVLNVLRRRATSVTREVTAAQEAMADKVIEYARGMAVLRTFATPDESLAAAKASFQQKRAADYHQEAAAQGILKLYALVFNLASCAVLFTACALYLNGALPLSWALTLLVAAFMIYGELIHANDAAFLTKKIEGELDRVDEVCDIPKQNATDAPLAPADFGIEMNGVSFGYDADRRVIDDVSLRIPQGTSCAIVGPSGSGKTTLVNLMARFWTPARCCSGARTCARARPRACSRTCRWCSRTCICSTTPWRTTSSSACRTPPMPTWRPPPGAPAATSSSCSCRRATTRCSRRAAPASRAGSASASPSRAPS